MNFEERWNMKGYICFATGNNDEFSGQNFQILGLQDAEVSKGLMHQIKGVSDFTKRALPMIIVNYANFASSWFFSFNILFVFSAQKYYSSRKFFTRCQSNSFSWKIKEKSIWYGIIILVRTYGRFSKKLTFLTTWYSQVRPRIRGRKC